MFLGLLSRKEVAPEQEGEQEAGVCLRSKFNSLGKSLHLGKGIGVKSWGVLCLGVHGTWKAGGADIGEGAAVSGRRESVWFLGRLARKEVALGRI